VCLCVYNIYYLLCYCVSHAQVDGRGKPRVWICRDKISGQPRGDGIVGYELPQAARMAIDRFHSQLLLLLS